jgi:hypothetical protein
MSSSAAKEVRRSAQDSRLRCQLKNGNYQGNGRKTDHHAPLQETKSFLNGIKLGVTNLFQRINLGINFFV